MNKHPRNKRFFCPDCGKGFKTEVGRDAHEKIWHKADRQGGPTGSPKGVALTDAGTGPLPIYGARNAESEP